MRSLVRFTLALGAALALGMIYPLAQQAQVKLGKGKGGRLQPAAASPATNYQVTQTTGAVVPGTTLVNNYTIFGIGGANDDAVAQIALPFTSGYTFYDQTYTTAFVSTNGNIQFASSNPDYGQAEVCFPLAQFSYAIMPHWGDLVIRGANEGIFTSVTDPDNDPATANSIFNIEWRASLIGNAPGSLNFEVRLYENQTRFDIIYGTAPGGGTEVTVGAEKGGGNPAFGNTFTEFSCHSNTLYNGLALIFNGTNDANVFIAGRVTDSDRTPLGGITINLSGAATATTTTDANGEYIFTGLTRNNTYTVAAAQQGFDFYPPSKTFGGTGNRAFTGNFIVNFIRTVPPNPGDVLISEFRFRGSASGAAATDEFIELVNNTDHGITVNALDGSTGWLIQSSAGSPAPISFSIQNGTTIPARGHYLAGNGSSYNLFGYGSADLFYGGDIPDAAGVALFSTSDAAVLDTNHRLDAVGFSAEPNPLYREGAGLASPGANDGNYSFVRKLVSGRAQDTDDNAQDFVFVSTNGGNYGGVQSQLGAPGPENTASPVQRNAQIKGRLLDPVAGPNAAPNRVRDIGAVTNGAAGTLVLRRRFTNSTGVFVTRLRFRVVDITTLNSPGYTPGGAQADIRVLSSSDSNVNTSSGSQFVRGLTLEQAPVQTDFGTVVLLAQPNGGGLNSSLAAGSITVAQPLAPGAFVNVEFKLGVQQGGSFRFFVNIEALP